MKLRSSIIAVLLVLSGAPFPAGGVRADGPRGQSPVVAPEVRQPPPMVPARVEAQPVATGWWNPVAWWPQVRGLFDRFDLPGRVVGVFVLFGLASVLLITWVIMAFSHPRGPALDTDESGLRIALGKSSPLGGWGDVGTPASPLRASRQSVDPRLRFDQERWNLPGFLSLYQPLLRLNVAAPSVAEHEGPAALRSYRYETVPGSQSGFADLHALVLELFRRAARAEPAEQALFLRNSKGDLFCYGRMRGDVLMRDNFQALQNAGVLEELRSGGAVFSRDGSALYLPLFCVEGFVGYYVFLAGRPLFSKELVEELWFEVRRFSERAWQGRLFDSAVRDPESGLYAGAMFHHDLTQTAAVAATRTRQLTLLQLSGRAEAIWPLLHSALDQSFPGCTAYRIGLWHAALLGPVMSESAFSDAIAEVLGSLRVDAAIDLNAGLAVLEESVPSAEHWFRRAEVALEEAVSGGVNHFRVWTDPVAGERLARA